MPNPISDPSYELGLAWTYTGQGERQDQGAIAYAGSWVGRLRMLRGLGTINSTIEQADLALPNVRGRRLRFWHRTRVNPGDKGFKLRVSLKRGAATLYTTDLAAGTDVWVEHESALVVPPATDGVSVRLETVYTLGGVPVGVAEWWVDGFEFFDPLEVDVAAKRKAIRAAMVSNLENVTVLNGYSTDIGEVTDRYKEIRDVDIFPTIQVVAVSEEKDGVRSALHRRVGVITFVCVVICEGPGADDACEDIAGDIEKELETQDSAQFLGLGYVDNVKVVRIDPAQPTKAVSREVRVWLVWVEVKYTHARTQP